MTRSFSLNCSVPTTMPTKAEETAFFVNAARRSFFAYMAFVHETDMDDAYEGAAVPAPHHMQMLEILTDESLKHAVILAPRDAAKTTLVQGYLEWKLGRASRSGDKRWANRFRALYVSATAAQAYRVSNGIRETILSNPNFQATFPEIKPHKRKFGEEEWKIQGNTIKDANFTAMGMDGPSVGTRANIVILDDISDPNNTGSQLQRLRVHDRLTEVISPISEFVPNSRVIMVATRWHWEDGVAWAQKRNWKVLKIQAIQQDEEGNDISYWPARVPLETLYELRKAGPKSFARQYQNDVIPEEGLVFERAWFKERFTLLPGPDEKLLEINSWDTAAGQGRNRSWSAGWAIRVTKDFHCYFHQLSRAQVAYTYLKMGIKALAIDTHADKVIIEKKSSGHAVLDEFALDPEMRHKIIEWQPFGQKGSPSRQSANEAIAALGEQGRIHLPSDMFLRKTGADWMPIVEQELFSYPEGESDDIVDAMCQALYYVRGLQINHEKLLASRTRHLPQRWEAPRSPEWSRPVI